MAITNTRTVQRIEVYPAETDPSMMVVYEHTFDDTEDDQLPVTTSRVKHLSRYTEVTADDGTSSSVATDVTGEDQLVRDICAAVWTD